MSNRDITEAQRVLRDFEGGHEAYAPNVAPMARALKKHTESVIMETLKPLRDLCANALAANDAHQTIVIPVSSVLAAMHAGVLLRDDPELSEKLATYLSGVAPMQEERFEEVASGTVRKPHDGLLDG